MAANTSLDPIGPKEFGEIQARHLLNRAGFGGTPAQIRALAGMGVQRAVDQIVDYQSLPTTDLSDAAVDPDIVKPPTAEQRRMMQQARRDNSDNEELRRQFQAMRRVTQRTDRQQYRELKRWWLARMIATPRPLEEKLTLLWHGHFASNYRTVRDSYLMFKQNELFRHHAHGSFADLAGDIVHDPAMIRFLDNHNNHRRKPNENLARELMELFTLGEGNYTEKDIQEGARALTGFTFRDNDFQFVERMHDRRKKTILGQTGDLDGDDFVRILLNQKACPRFISFKIYRHFVADVDDDQSQEDAVTSEAVRKIAGLLVRSRYELGPVLKRLFRSRHFYDPNVIGNKIKSPAQLVVGTVRMLNTPLRDLNTLAESMALMGQNLLDPPSVAGWSGGRSWINTSTLFIRQNLCTYLITGKRTGDRAWRRNQVAYDPMSLVEGLPTRSPETVVDHLLTTLIARPVPSPQRDELVALIKQRRGIVTTDTVIALLLLITAMPEYQLC